MDKAWLLITIFTASMLLALLKGQEVKSLQRFREYTPKLKLQSFQTAAESLPEGDRSLLRVWESIVSGRTSSDSKKERLRYQELGLMHLFTPSGFHLSAVSKPIYFILKNPLWRWAFLIALGVYILSLPGLAALKRMVLIKWNQAILGKKIGFLIALGIDCFWGSFSASPISFSYSVLFLGIIYSGLRGFGLVMWFFIAQAMLAYFREESISPLNLFLSPLLNGLYGLIMPLLFALSFPLWDWQLQLGLLILSIGDWTVRMAHSMILMFPLLEIHAGTLLVLGLIICRRPRVALLGMLFWTGSLNLDLQKQPSSATYEFRPKDFHSNSLNGTLIFSEGKCRGKLVRGFWWEKCSPHRRALVSLRKL